MIESCEHITPNDLANHISVNFFKVSIIQIDKNSKLMDCCLLVSGGECGYIEANLIDLYFSLILFFFSFFFFLF